MSTTITGYVIAKNEAATLERTLTCLRSLCDEVVVGVDDSSTDETEIISRELADRVVPFQWQDDFSVVRNQVLAECSGDWIVHLDGHEHFAVQQQPYPDASFRLGREAAEIVRDTILQTDRERPEIKVLGCAVKIHCDENLIAQIVSVQERIFRRGLTYRNPVHNVLTGYEAEEAMGFLDLLVLHDRPPERETARAEQRNEMLPRRMQERVQADADDLRSWSYLQRHAMVMKDWPSVLHYGEAYRKNAERLERDWGDELYQTLLHCAIASRLLDPPDYDRAESYLQHCLRIHPFKREHWLEWSAVAGARCDWRRQEDCLRVATVLPFDGRNSKGTFDERIYTYIPHQLLSEFYEGQGAITGAIEESRSVCRYRPRSADAMARLGRLENGLREMQVEQARQTLALEKESGPIRWVKSVNANEEVA